MPDGSTPGTSEFYPDDSMETLDCRSLTPSLLATLLSHFLCNALDYLPCKADDDCTKKPLLASGSEQEVCVIGLTVVYERCNVEEARRDLIAWQGKWQAKYPKL